MLLLLQKLVVKEFERNFELPQQPPNLQKPPATSLMSSAPAFIVTQRKLFNKPRIQKALSNKTGQNEIIDPRLVSGVTDNIWYMAKGHPSRRVAPYGFCSDGKNTSLSILLWSYLSDTQLLSVVSCQQLLQVSFSRRRGESNTKRT